VAKPPNHHLCIVIDPSVTFVKFIEHLLKRRVRQFFFIGPSDAPKYNIIWTKNSNAIDRLISELLTFEECSKRLQHVFGHTLDTL